MLMEGMRVTSSSNQEVMQKCILFGLDSPYIQTAKSNFVALKYNQMGLFCLDVWTVKAKKYFFATQSVGISA